MTERNDIIASEELQKSTTPWARSIFLRFVSVTAVLNVFAATAVVVYDLADSVATTRDTLEKTGRMVGKMADRMSQQGNKPERTVTELSDLTGMPMALLNKNGKVLLTTDPELDLIIPRVYQSPEPGMRMLVSQELDGLSGGWVLRKFGSGQFLLTVVPHLPEDEGKLMYVTISGGVLLVGLIVSFLTMLGTANWMLRRPLSKLVEQLVGALGRDMEQRYQAERVAIAARLDAEEHLGFRDNLLDAADQLGIVATDADGLIKLMNKGAERMLGYSNREVVGARSLEDLWTTMSRPAEEQMPLRSLFQLAPGERFVVDKQGKERLLAFNISAIVDGEGNKKGGLAVFMDVSERKRLEAELQLQELQLIQTAKLASLGEMASGVAHELNQPLNNIGLLATRIANHARKGCLDAQEVLGKVEKVRGQIDRASKIIDQMRTFAQPHARRMRSFGVEDPIHNALDFLRAQFSHRGIRVELDIPSGLPPVIADDSQLEQVLVNLLLNARDALADHRVDDRWILISAEMGTLEPSPVPAVCLHVADNGPGIPEPILPRVFEPFFTTKEVGKGTGLGLSISYGLVRGFGGQLLVRSAPGSGAVFTVVLKADVPQGAIADMSPKSGEQLLAPGGASPALS